MNKKPFKAVDGPMIMLLAVAFMLLAQVVASFVIIAVEQQALYEIINCACMIVFQLVFLAVYLLYTKKRKTSSTFSVRNKITAWGLVASILIAIICFTCFIGPAYYFESLLSSMGYTAPQLDVTTIAGIVLLVVATVIAAPICEETIFRSALLSGLTKVRKDDIGVSLISGLCFALMHMNPSQTVYQFCLGSVAAYVALKCRNVLPAMIIHAISNLLALVMSFTSVGVAVDEFYMLTGQDALVTVLTCVVLPIIACVAVWLICKYVKGYERKKHPAKYDLPPKIIWIDEVTKQPIYEGEDAPIITDENRMVQRGYSAFTGAPVMVDRLELQNSLMEEYHANNGEKSGGLGEKSYQTAFVIYFVATAFMWVLNFLSGFVIIN